MNKAFFFDRDGVIIKMVYDLEYDYIHTAFLPSEIEFIYGIFELLKKTKSLGYKNIIVSNQPDIGFGKISEKNFKEICSKINKELKKEDIVLDGEYYCFHHPFAELEPYRKECDCRKPKIGMLLKAAKDHQIDLSKSWIIGDGVNDIIAGKSAGCKTILTANLLESEYLRIIEKKLKKIKPDYIIKNLKETLNIIK